MSEAGVLEKVYLTMWPELAHQNLSLQVWPKTSGTHTVTVCAMEPQTIMASK